MLVRCLYASRAVQPLSDGVLGEILAQSRRNNPRHGITGMLCHANNYFVQVIEGGRPAVSNLLCRIVDDKRNSDMQILSFAEICERRFGGWTMGQVNLGKANPALILKYSEKLEFNPFGCTSAGLMALIDEIATSGAIDNRTF